MVEQMVEQIKVLANSPSMCAILIEALLEQTRSARRAKIAEVKALEKLEASLLTLQRAAQADDRIAPLTEPRDTAVTSSAHHAESQALPVEAASPVA